MAKYIDYKAEGRRQKAFKTRQKAEGRRHKQGVSCKRQEIRALRYFAGVHENFDDVPSIFHDSYGCPGQRWVPAWGTFFPLGCII